MIQTMRLFFKSVLQAAMFVCMFTFATNEYDVAFQPLHGTQKITVDTVQKAKRLLSIVYNNRARGNTVIGLDFHTTAALRGNTTDQCYYNIITLIILYLEQIPTLEKTQCDQLNHRLLTGGTSTDVLCKTSNSFLQEIKNALHNQDEHWLDKNAVDTLLFLAGLHMSCKTGNTQLTKEKNLYEIAIETIQALKKRDRVSLIILDKKSIECLFEIFQYQSNPALSAQLSMTIKEDIDKLSKICLQTIRADNSAEEYQTISRRLISPSAAQYIEDIRLEEKRCGNATTLYDALFFLTLATESAVLHAPQHTETVLAFVLVTTIEFIKWTWTILGKASGVLGIIALILVIGGMASIYSIVPLNR